MLFYICTFALSSLLFAFSDKTLGKISIFLASLAISIPVIIAGCRDETIGTDVLVYAEPIYTTASTNSLVSTIQGWNAGQPMGFIFVVWCLTFLFKDFAYVLAGIQVLVIVPIYITSRYFYSKNTWMCMAMYLLLFYPSSLNMMKQSIAMSLIFFSLIFCHQRSLLKFLLTILIAYLFHQTAILMIWLYPLYQIFVPQNNEPIKIGNKIILVYCCIFGLSALFFFANTLITFLGGIQESYSYMVNHQGESSFSTIPMIFLFFSFIVYFIVVKDSRSNPSFFEKNLLFLFIVIVCLGYIMSELSLFTQGLNRFGLYFQYFIMLFIVQIYKVKTTDIIKLCQYFMLMLAAASFVIYALNGANEIYPYTSTLLGIE